MDGKKKRENTIKELKYRIMQQFRYYEMDKYSALIKRLIEEDRNMIRLQAIKETIDMEQESNYIEE